MYEYNYEVLLLKLSSFRLTRHSMVIVPLDTPGVKLVRPLAVFGGLGEYFSTCVFSYFNEFIVECETAVQLSISPKACHN